MAIKVPISLPTDERLLSPSGHYLWRDFEGRKCWVPVEMCAPRKQRAFQIIGDIEPYKSVVDGSVVGSRRAHKEHLRRHGKIEVGNEWGGFPEPSTERPDAKPDIERALHELGAD